ncbi:alkaline phosphatase family protein [Desulfatibacillum aliphaticivorans]|uniref:alkaline phosphatase family protein n=1 Tax=Desulfatibacillum aliphaticivorans TaxID=218208 RepID=UPI0004158B84|nr:alkaline phosphatase family protein [Desulfatibacillum aliphaticivorans]
MADFHTSIGRRAFIKGAASTLAGLTAATRAAPVLARKTRQEAPKVVVLGIDGMDPFFTHELLSRGLLPHFARLANQGGFYKLATVNPPQSPVVWASFINGAGPGAHGLFDFIHRNPSGQCRPFYSAAQTIDGKTLCGRQGIPFWEALDQAGVPSVFYDLPADYPPSPSKKGNRRCLAGMGVPDLMGTHGTYQYFSHDGPGYILREGGGLRTRIVFLDGQAKARLEGPANPHDEQKPVYVEFRVKADPSRKSAEIRIQGQNISLREKEWSPWIRVEFILKTPFYMADKKANGICRFYLQEAAPGFRLYVSPINADPSDPILPLSEPKGFVRDIAKENGLFYTSGFQEDHKAFSNGIFSAREYEDQAWLVLKERERLLDYALDHYRDGLLFFYFSTLDLMSHMFWTDHDFRKGRKSGQNHERMIRAYREMDRMLGKVLDRLGARAAVMVMSDHGFAGFRRQFHVNAWLRDNGFLGSGEAESIMEGMDWKDVRAYGLGINGLYVNLKGREREGVVEPGRAYKRLVEELAAKLEAIRDANGVQVIKKAHRADRIYKGPASALAPDLVLGYSRGYRTSWESCLGGLAPQVLSDNPSAWAADHCCDASEVPGVLFTNRPLSRVEPSVMDIAPTVLSLYGLDALSGMEGRSLKFT